jgi:hypothetical protein
MASNGWMGEKGKIGKDLEVSGNKLITELSRYFLERLKKTT